tara:strand:+ start:979 stop:1764 length:786 start_codon:yes stop_codon:yes gene_type:complete
MNLLTFLYLVCVLLVTLYLFKILFNKLNNKVSTFTTNIKLSKSPKPYNNTKIMYPNIHKSIIDCSQKFDLERLYEYDNFISDELCDKIIELSKPLIERSSVLDKDNPIDTNRTSSNTFLKINDNIKIIDKRINNLLGIPIEFYEDLQVVNYKPGQLYKAHYDACGKNDDYCKEVFDKLGKNNNRYATFIIYLNDNMTGGETEFPKKNIEVKPKKGKAVLFFNLNDDYTDVRENSFHGGKPPTTGEKWMCNKWVRLNELLKV